MNEQSLAQASDDLTEQLEALRRHIEAHDCEECKRRFHELINAIQAVVFGKDAPNAPGV